MIMQVTWKYLWNKSLGFASLHKMDGVAHQGCRLVAQEHLSDVVQHSYLNVGILRWCHILNRGDLNKFNPSVLWTYLHEKLPKHAMHHMRKSLEGWAYHCEINVQVCHVRAQGFRVTFDKFLLGWMQESSHILWEYGAQLPSQALQSVCTVIPGPTTQLCHLITSKHPDSSEPEWTTTHLEKRW